MSNELLFLHKEDLKKVLLGNGKTIRFKSIDEKDYKGRPPLGHRQVKLQVFQIAGKKDNKAPDTFDIHLHSDESKHPQVGQIFNVYNEGLEGTEVTLKKFNDCLSANLTEVIRKRKYKEDQEFNIKFISETLLDKNYKSVKDDIFVDVVVSSEVPVKALIPKFPVVKFKVDKGTTIGESVEALKVTNGVGSYLLTVISALFKKAKTKKK